MKTKKLVSAAAVMMSPWPAAGGTGSAAATTAGSNVNYGGTEPYALAIVVAESVADNAGIGSIIEFTATSN